MKSKINAFSCHLMSQIIDFDTIKVLLKTTFEKDSVFKLIFLSQPKDTSGCPNVSFAA